MSVIRFLIADASQGLHTFMQQWLTGNGFEASGIRCASNPHAALEIAAELQPDFLLTDWFPKESLDGFGLYRQILLRSPGCRFAMLSADASNHNRQVAQDAGAIFLLKKPCTAPELRGALTNALELLAVENPKIASRMLDRKSALARTPALSQLPIHIPKFEAGEHVLYQGRREMVKYVILRRGELVVQLQGRAGLIPATQVQKQR